ncbi:hypothetical protein EDD16DRAFT_1514727 [Pisolithus croceorrhizus]|nr:hypothetical protein EDD16DRAFT_1514727 [Pisolithus croceorrhizus]
MVNGKDIEVYIEEVWQELEPLVQSMASKGWKEISDVLAKGKADAALLSTISAWDHFPMLDDRALVAGECTSLDCISNDSDILTLGGAVLEGGGGADTWLDGMSDIMNADGGWGRSLGVSELVRSAQ